jgi:hypothetical protein
MKAKKDNGATASISTKRDVERFRKAADAYGSSATRSPEAAREALVSLGIYTKSGKLTKNYSR